jgi:ElaB/YqjD/DUF883 family membrane-anchored ribosome-binding protein
MRAGEETQSLAGQAKERAEETARDMKGQTREQLRSQLAERSTEAGEQAASAVRALRRASSQLREEGNERAAGMVDALADRGQRLGEYLRDAEGEQLLRDIEEFARRQPWLVAGGSAVVGFLGSRFVKASSHGRYRSSREPQGYPARGAIGSPGHSALPTASPAGEPADVDEAGFTGGSGRLGE